MIKKRTLTMFTRIAILSFLLIATFGCSKYKWAIHQTAEKYNDCLSIYFHTEPTGIPEFIKIAKTGSSNVLNISNLSDQIVYINYNKSYMVFNNQTYKVVSGETRVINSETAVPNKILAPQTDNTVTFFAPQIAELTKGAGREIWFNKISILLETEDTQDYRIEIAKPNCSLTPPEKAITTFETKIPPVKKYSCWATGIFYGGTCWIPATKENKDEAIARFKEANIFYENYSHDDFILKYEGRDWSLSY